MMNITRTVPFNQSGIQSLDRWHEAIQSFDSIVWRLYVRGRGFDLHCLMRSMQ